MLHPVQINKRFMWVFLIIITLVTGSLLFRPAQARADICVGAINGCGQTGDRGLVIKGEGKTAPEKHISGKDFSGGNLHGINLTGADLSNANLTRVELSGANLSEVKLSKANISGADFSGIDWSKVNLSKPDLLTLIQVNLTGGGWMYIPKGVKYEFEVGPLGVLMCYCYCCCCA